MSRKSRWMAAVAVLALAWLGSVFYVVQVSEFVLVLQFGKPVATREAPGLYVKLPWPLQACIRLDRRTQVYETKMVEYLTRDKKNLLIQAYVCWRIEAPLRFHQALRVSEYAEQRLDDGVLSLIGATIGDYEMGDVISTDAVQSRLKEIEEALLLGMQERFAADYGVGIRRVGISRLALPDDNARSVYQRMRAERAAIAAQYRAEGREQADRIRALADQQRSELLADAAKHAAILRGEADAEAAEVYAEAYGRSPELFRLLKSLDACKQFMGPDTTLVLPSDAGLLRYLNLNDGTADVELER